jgi:hypothetical protein
VRSTVQPSTYVHERVRFSKWACDRRTEMFLVEPFLGVPKNQKTTPGPDRRERSGRNGWDRPE